MIRDLRHAVRMLLHSKGWTLVVILSLALGIGANTAIFGAINGVVLRTLPVAHPETLARFRSVGENDMGTDFSDYGYTEKENGLYVSTTFSYPMFGRFRQANQTLVDLIACAPQGQVNVFADGRAELASLLIATGNYFQMLEVRAIAGRTFTPDDDRPGSAPVAVISYGYWQRRFGGEPGVVGRVVQLSNVPVTIIGVTPREFTGIQQVMTDARDITLPIVLDPQFGGAVSSGSFSGAAPANNIPRLAQPTSWWLQIMGRLKPGVTVDQVRGNLEGVFQDAAREGWTSYLGSLRPDERSLARYQNRTKVPRLRVSSGSRGIYDVSADTYRSMTLLGVVVALVLLIVCANVANLLLSRAATRQREISVRLSMGATRGRLIRQLLTESVLLAAIGGTCGLFVAYWGKQLLSGTGLGAPANRDVSPWPALLDWRVLAFVGGLTLLTGVAFGLAPAVRATRANVGDALKEGSRSLSGGRTTLGKLLLVAQVAISIVLLIGAGLFLRTVRNLRNVNVGFDTGNLLLVPVSPGLNHYDPARFAALYEQMLDRLRGVPGVRAVSSSNPALLSGSTNITMIFVQGRARPGDQNRINRLTVAPTFFETMGIPVLTGRGFAARDNQNAPKVAIINEEAVRRYFPDQNPIGLRFGTAFETREEMEIVGVVRNAKYNSVRDAVPPTMYVPYLQARPGMMTFELRTAGDPTQAVPAVRETIRQIDPALPVLNVSTQSEQVERRFAQERVFAQAYALFGGLALLLASIGLFGLMSYSVARRTNEIGIRMALGADRSDVIGMVMRESMLLVVIGVVVGSAAALASGRFVTSLLYGLAPTDATTMAAATALMVAVSALAGYLPARTASKVDPMIALRYE